MTALVPNRYLFSFEFPLRYRADAPNLERVLDAWTDAELLPKLGELDDQPEFADVWACWNEGGLYVACRVDGKRKPLNCDPRSFWTSDHLRLCTDMRDARTVKRATKFCQMFYFLPSGGGPRKSEPAAGTAAIRQAREPAPRIPAELLVVTSRVGRTGYELSAHVPAACLNGFDPFEHRRIGFYYMLEDAEHGQQPLTVGDDLKWYIDPSTWPTAVLSRE